MISPGLFKAKQIFHAATKRASCSATEVAGEY